MELKCPNCETVLEVSSRSKDTTVCKKCLLNLGKRFIMTETGSGPKYENLGDGFFTKR